MTRTSTGAYRNTQPESVKTGRAVEQVAQVDRSPSSADPAGLGRATRPGDPRPVR